MPTRMIGTVAGVHRDKGFFFICGSDGRDYFAFARDLPNHQSLNTLVAQVTRIEFEPEERSKGPAAIRLLVLDDTHEVQPDDPTARQLGLSGKRRRG